MSGPESAGEVSFSGIKFHEINHEYVQGGPSGRGQAFVDIEKKSCVLVYEVYTVAELLI